MLNTLLNKEILLPPGCIWPPNIKFKPDVSHVYTYPIIIAILLYFVRCLFER